MVLLKRKPVLYTPLPSLSTILQPLSALNGETSAPSPSTAAAQTTDEAPVPADAEDDEEQLEKLRSVFRGEFEGAQGMVGAGKGKKAGTRLLSSTTAYSSHQTNGTIDTNGAHLGPVGGLPESENGDSDPAQIALMAHMAHMAQFQQQQNVPQEPAPQTEEDSSASTLAALTALGAMLPPPVPAQAPAPAPAPPVHWRIWDRECYYVPETGEIFTDYETFLARVTFYQQSLYQCESSSKNNITYYKAHESEALEARQLHTRFPRQLKMPVLKSVQFQIEGKMEKLVDIVFDRFQFRFFDDERVFVDIEGDKYLATIVNTVPPASLASSSQDPLAPHAFASDLNMPEDELNRVDDPMAYSYNVRLIERGSAEDLPPDYAGSNPLSEALQKTVEIHAKDITRLHFSKMMLKRFLRDCVHREAAVYSPWLLKTSVAERYGLPTEMSDAVKDRIATYRERQMDRRKREREERMGLTHPSEMEVTEDEKPKTKKAKKEEVVQVEEEELPKIKKAVIKYPIDDLLVQYSDYDASHDKPRVRPSLNLSLPFGEHFEKFLMSWSFLNVMGKPLGLSPFTLDDYEQALYHNDPYQSTSTLMSEIHSSLINILISDLAAGHEAVKPLSLTGMGNDNDIDYWEGTKGATAETLRPVAEPLSKSWYMRFLSPKDNRKGWEAALVGCLWERASLETLPSYLDNILHLTFEDKPAPTRPTWSTGPSQASGNGLIPSKPEKRYLSLHHLHKLEIVAFLTELAAQTASIRDFMEEETLALTESRKEYVEVKREWKRVQAELAALTPKEELTEDANGEIIINDAELPKSERAGSIDLSLNGHPVNGRSTDRDELDSSPAPMDEDMSEIDNGDEGAHVTAASRRRAMKEKAAEREAEEAMRIAKVAQDKVKKSETKQQAAEKKRLEDEFSELSTKLRHVDYDLRAHMYALRAKPLGLDRFGNKVWWLDGYGSAVLINEKGQPVLGTGRIYVQGVETLDLELLRLAVANPSPEEKQGLEGVHRPDGHEVEQRRQEEEGEKLKPGQWAAYDTVEQLNDFVKWLNPKGYRDLNLIKSLKMWMPEIEAGITKRRILAGLEDVPEGEEPVKKARPVRKVVAAGGGDRGQEDATGFMAWKNRRAKEK